MATNVLPGTQKTEVYGTDLIPGTKQQYPETETGAPAKLPTTSVPENVSSLNQLLGPFLYSLAQGTQNASPTTNPALEAMVKGLAPQYASLIQQPLAEYSANVASLPQLIQGAISSSGQAAVLGDYLNYLKNQLVYNGPTGLTSAEQAGQPTLNLILQGLGGSAGATPQGQGILPTNLSPSQVGSLSAPPTTSGGWGSSTNY